jgi:hypothetical protein
MWFARCGRLARCPAGSEISAREQTIVSGSLVRRLRVGRAGMTGITNNLVVPASTFGEQTRVPNFAQAARSRLRWAWGPAVSIPGQIPTEPCFVIDSPRPLLDCRAEPGWGRADAKQGAGELSPAGLLHAAGCNTCLAANFTMTTARKWQGRSGGTWRHAPRTIETCTATVVEPLINREETLRQAPFEAGPSPHPGDAI